MKGFTQKDVTQGPVTRQLLSFMLPILASQILQQFYSVADTAIVGRFAGPAALAAVGIGGLLLSVILNFFIGMTTGISCKIAAHFGAHDYNSLRKALHTTMALCCVAGVLFTVLGLAGTRAFLAYMDTPPDIVEQSALYLSICFLGMLPQLIYNMGNSILQALGNTRSPFVYLTIASLVHLVLDFLLIPLSGDGIRGAALATLLAQALSAVLILHKLANLDARYALRMDATAVDLGFLRGILCLGIPAGMQALFMSISSLVIQNSINSFGSAAVAGMTVFARVEGFVYFPLFSLGLALTAFVGQNYGAGKTDRIREAVKKSLRLAVGFGGIGGAVLLAAAHPTLRLFTDDAAVLAIGFEALLVQLPMYWLYGVNQVYIGTIRGLGAPSYPMVTSLISYCVFRVVFCESILPLWHSMDVIFLSYDLSWVIMVALLVAGYRHYMAPASAEVADSAQAAVPAGAYPRHSAA